MSSNISQAISDPAVSRNQKAHWKIPLSILVLGVVAQSFFWWLWTDDLTHQVFSAYFVWPTTVFLLLLWWSFFSGLPRRTRGYGLVFAASATALFFVLIRVTFDGAMIPQLSWRWWGNADPDWADGETGPRSDQSFEMQNRVEQETKRLQAIQKSLSDKKSAIQLKTAEFAPAEFLRVHGEKNWDRWE